MEKTRTPNVRKRNTKAAKKRARLTEIARELLAQADLSHAEFIIDRERGHVDCIFTRDGEKFDDGARTHPNGEFVEEIGMVIAFYRAIDREGKLPMEFLELAF
jgi:hypothetical protein